MLPITKAGEPVKVESAIVVVYGEPGVGKTSIACTTENPIILDFDRGSHRSQFRKDAVRISSWPEIAGITAQDVAAYDTIVIDTVGRCLDLLSADIIERDPKKGRGGALTLQGYGSLKAEFTAFLNAMRSYGKDVVLIGHHKEEKNGDDSIVRLEATGSSRDEVMKAADSVGFLHMVNGERILDFNPTDAYTGKNPAGFDALTVPSFHSAPGWFAGIMSEIKNQLGDISEQSRQIAEKVGAFREAFAKLKSAKALTEQIAVLQEVDDQPKPVILQAKRLLMDRAKELGISYDKEKGKFVPPPKAVSAHEGDETAPEAETAAETQQEAGHAAVSDPA